MNYKFISRKTGKSIDNESLLKCIKNRKDYFTGLNRDVLTYILDLSNNRIVYLVNRSLRNVFVANLRPRYCCFNAMGSINLPENCFSLVKKLIISYEYFYVLRLLTKVNTLKLFINKASIEFADITPTKLDNLSIICKKPQRTISHILKYFRHSNPKKLSIENGFFRFPEEVKIIEKFRFERCTVIGAIVFPETTKEIIMKDSHGSRFDCSKCTNLMNLTIPNIQNVVYLFGSQLKTLKCNNINPEVEFFPSSLTKLHLYHCSDLINLTNLKLKSFGSHYGYEKILDNRVWYKTITELDLPTAGGKFDILKFENLIKLTVNNCDELQFVCDTNIRTLKVYGQLSCPFESLTTLTSLDIGESVHKNFEILTNLRKLYAPIFKLNRLQMIKLKSLEILKCWTITTIPIESLSHIKTIICNRYGKEYRKISELKRLKGYNTKLKFF